MTTPGPAVGMRTHYCGTLRESDVGKNVSVCGWVARRREHGEHLAFVDVRDYTGIIQCVVDGAQALRSEYVVRVSGTVRLRPEGTANPGLATGAVELGECKVEVLSTAEPPPFVLDGRAGTDEAIRLRYRFIDLRSERLQANLRRRAVMNRAIREAMDGQGFVEIETPLLWTPTPEGAREFAIPSRLQPGNFYVLPQSPQIAKQLSMVGGFDRYYQIARCMRDEDLRADRQFEFTQLDLEASFVTQEDILGFVTEAMRAAVMAVSGQEPTPFERMTWAEAIDAYGTEKPDLRAGPALVECGEALSDTEFAALRAPSVKGLRVVHGGDTGRARLDALTARARELGGKGLAWLRVTGEPGHIELESPIVKYLSEAERKALVVLLDAAPGDLLLLVASERRKAAEILGAIRAEINHEALDTGELRFVWVVDFPLFEGLDDTGNPIAAHHPFTMPYEEDLALVEKDPLAVRAHSYDLVLNGWELGSGSIRIHHPDVQAKVFDALGIATEEATARFGFLLDAFRYGAPPHGGFAVGLDRFVAIVSGEENIREVIAFPKTQSGADLMTGAPKPLTSRQLSELGLRLEARAAR